jgi:hypothetical protein
LITFSIGLCVCILFRKKNFCSKNLHVKAMTSNLYKVGGESLYIYIFLKTETGIRSGLKINYQKN